ncbi:MAG TPA: hypothetical protein VF988_06540, partial [Verrucomicrobiae bacterium]
MNINFEPICASLLGGAELLLLLATLLVFGLGVAAITGLAVYLSRRSKRPTAAGLQPLSPTPMLPVTPVTP